MRFIVLILVTIFFYQSHARANDIRNFEIEGMSIGDSLLNYFDEGEILNSIEDSYYSYVKKNPGKFKGVEFRELTTLNTYDAVQFAIKKNDENYKIYLVKGMIVYEDNIKECYNKLNEIDKNISGISSNLIRHEEFSSHEADPSGKSKVQSILYFFKDGSTIEIECYDWSEKIGYLDHLRVGTKHFEFTDWLLEK